MVTVMTRPFHVSGSAAQLAVHWPIGLQTHAGSATARRATRAAAARAGAQRRAATGAARVLPARRAAGHPTMRLRLIGLGPPFRDRFAAVSDRFSGSWCRFLESWGSDGEDGEKMGKKRGKMGEKWPKESGSNDGFMANAPYPARRRCLSRSQPGSDSRSSSSVPPESVPPWKTQLRRTWFLYSGGGTLSPSQTWNLSAQRVESLGAE